MSLPEGVEYKQVPAAQVAGTRFHMKTRLDVRRALEELSAAIPSGVIDGPPYLHIQSFSSYTEGWSAEVGFPVSKSVNDNHILEKTLPAMEVLSLVHTGPHDTIRESRAVVHEFARQQALISDEFSREVYLGWPDPEGPIEVNFVIHNWNRLLAENVERVLGKPARDTILQSGESLSVETPPRERFDWCRRALLRLDGIATEAQVYDVVSGCAHVFPEELLDNLRLVYNEARARGEAPLQAVDAVLAFMETDPAWNAKGHSRDGHVIRQTKHPADPQAYAAAQTDDERRAAYCFCPVIRPYLDSGMPFKYCYCGAGWYRQQWEAVTGKPVTVEIVQSVLKGDPVCEFATHLAEDL